MYTLFNGLQPYTNGTNGITGIDTIIGSYYNPNNIKILFYVALVFLVLVYALTSFLISTKVWQNTCCYKRWGKQNIFLWL